MGESSGPAEVLAPRVDLEGTVDFMKKWGGGLIVEVDVKAIGPLVLTGGHFNETIGEQIREGSTVSYSCVTLTGKLSRSPFAVGAVWFPYVTLSSSLKSHAS